VDQVHLFVFRTHVMSMMSLTVRECLVEGTFKRLGRDVLANALGLYIQPDYATAMLNTDQTRHGHP
jgi:hypothetical protein